MSASTLTSVRAFRRTKRCLPGSAIKPRSTRSARSGKALRRVLRLLLLRLLLTRRKLLAIRCHRTIEARLRPCVHDFTCRSIQGTRKNTNRTIDQRNSRIIGVVGYGFLQNIPDVARLPCRTPQASSSASTPGRFEKKSRVQIWGKGTLVYFALVR